MQKTSGVCPLKGVGVPFLSPFLLPAVENMDAVLSHLGLYLLYERNITDITDIRQNFLINWTT